MCNERFEELLNDVEVNFEGWDFSFLEDRMVEFPLPWSYKVEVKKVLSDANSMLDMGTGGGEFLSSLSPLPPKTCATEGYEPNIKIAKDRLEPLGINVYGIINDEHLPIDNDSFDLVINRHEAFSGKELHRVLKNDGLFITQQVGGLNESDLNLRLGVNQSEFFTWSLTRALNDLKQNSLEIVKSRDCITKTRFYDIGALVFYLKAIPWQIPNFTVELYKEQLKDLHNLIEEQGYVDFLCHRFFIIAKNKK